MPRSGIALAVLAAALSLGHSAALAHHAGGHAVPSPIRPAENAALETIGGTLESLPVLDRRTGSSLRYFTLRQADGTRVPLQWLSAEHAQSGADVRLEGKRSGDAFFVESAATLSKAASVAPTVPSGTKRYSGTLEFLYADDLDHGRCELVYSLKASDGTQVPVRFPVAPEILEEGMHVAIDGVTGDDGVSVDAHAVEILPPDAQSPEPEATPSIAGTTQVLVILLKFQDTTTEPYTQTAVQSTVFSGASSVANFFRETSYGKHALAGTVTPWLTARFTRPTTCNYSGIAAEASYMARQAGYDTTKFQKYVYVFPSLSCSWAGLGGGSQAWINQAASVKVIGHELGHTFGLGHASSLDCGTAVIGGTCTRSEYGDPYEIMGNNRAAHLNAPHKMTLGYFATSEVKTHGGGTATYTLSALETPGGATYAVRVPANATRTYWLEWRQPIGFDASITSGGTNGALVHIAAPTDYGCSTCILDMTPATTAFTDAALPVGQTFSDAKTGASISVLAKTATSLSVEVTTPTRPTFADVPATHSAYAAIEAIAWSDITSGCASAPLRFCPGDFVTRAEMAVFLERAKRGSSTTFTATGTKFADVPATHWAGGFIEQLYTDGITNGCASNPLRFCPSTYLTRAQMAPFLMKARYGSTFNPGTASGTVFGDVPKTHSMAAWIERLYLYGITLGCTSNPRNYCPDAFVTRAQMALFLQRTFALQAPPS